MHFREHFSPHLLPALHVLRVEYPRRGVPDSPVAVGTADVGEDGVLHGREGGEVGAT